MTKPVNKLIDQVRCGTCDYWHRGGLGHGRGSGSCITYGLARDSSNLCARKELEEAHNNFDRTCWTGTFKVSLPKQKVIKKMRDGWLLDGSENSRGSKFAPSLKKQGEEDIRVNQNILHAMINDGILEKHQKDQTNTPFIELDTSGYATYTLTKLSEKVSVTGEA